jgi:hypothetical protein
LLRTKKFTVVKKDTVIFDLIQKEYQRQKNGVELIASENFVSPQVLEAMGSVLTNKYAEGYPGHRYYGGCEVVDQTEQMAIDRLKELYHAEYVNVQPHSGAQANMAVLMTVLKPGDTFLGLDLSHGGHLSHGSPVNSSGILYRPVAYGVDPGTGLVDYDAMEEIALREKPKLIIGGASAYSREWNYKRMREIADKVGAMLMIDMAHPAGLIAAGLLDNPLESPSLGGPLYMDLLAHGKHGHIQNGPRLERDLWDPGDPAPELDGAQLGRFVLQGEIDVAGCRPLQLGDLPFHPDRVERPLQELAALPIQLRYGVYAFLHHHTECSRSVRRREISG